jgi:hypothetical protein
MKFYWLIIGILAVWRLTHLLALEDGPWDIIVRLRRKVGTSIWGNLLDCFYCLSLWISIPFAYVIGSTWLEIIILWPAVSAGSIIIEMVTSSLMINHNTIYFEDEDTEDKNVLR